MLTIRKPIELRVQQPMQAIRADLAERLTANYELMRMPIRKEELLHITSEPPEVYFAEGDQIQMFSNFRQENQQNLRLDVINNLVNRIMVAQTENFSYQDTVYISSVLRRLGIRDEKTFMKQVFALQNEHKETKQLLRQYETNQILLQELFAGQEQQRQAEGGTPAPTAISTENRYYLHDAIFKRLETGKIYQDMRDFSRDVNHISNQIFRAEMTIGEQAALVQNFHLHALKQKIMGDTMPLYYYHNNQYEYLQENLEELNQTLEEQMSAAILLNLIDQSYSLRQQQIEKNDHYWYSLAGALFQTAENTWKRYEYNLTEQKQASQNMLQLLEEVNEVKRQEGDTLTQITEEYHALTQQWRSEQNLRQTILQQNRSEQTREEINLSGGSYHLTQEELQLQYLQPEGEEGSEEASTEAVTAEQLQRQLEVFNQRNFENYRKLTEIERQHPQKRERKPDRKRAQQDALRALENPEEVLREYLTTEIHDPAQEAQRQIESQIYEMFSEETKEIYRQFLQQNPSAETTFLQHIMAQPEESEVRSEVEQVLHQVQQREIVQQLQREFTEHSETLRPMLSQTIRQSFSQQLNTLQELQNTAIYQQWTQPTEIYWRQEQEAGEAPEIAGVQREREMLVTERERTIRTASEGQPMQGEEITRRQTLTHPIRTEQTEEIVRTAVENTVVEQQEQQLTEIRQTIEKQIQRQQSERLTELMTTQRELQFRQVDFVHKAEEQLIGEEILETIRSRQQATRREEHSEERLLQQEKSTQTIVQDTVNHMQTRQMENIEELVQQSVRKQLNNLSDQVYGKIEKKLSTERKRRGYQ